MTVSDTFSVAISGVIDFFRLLLCQGHIKRAVRCLLSNDKSTTCNTNSLLFSLLVQNRRFSLESLSANDIQILNDDNDT
jgi:hypothetical protein